MKELDELITYIENDLIGEHKDIEIIDEAIKKYAELYHKKQLKLCGVGVSLPKVCTGCGRLSIDKIDKQYLACCPDNNYIPLRDYVKKSKYIEVQFPTEN